MDYSREQVRGFLEEFRRMRGRQSRVALVYALPGFLDVLAGAVVFSLRNGRSPACNGYLGRDGPALLSESGVALQ